MVLGTHSGAGKSWLTTALARCYANAGYKVAPFKAQNMSNNARVVALPGGGWGEIGAAQYFQAQAARAVPDVRMNPVLLKPEADTRSQVVVCGRVRPDLADVPWRERSALLWPHAREALQSLRAEHEVVVIEGAGSPAEINLAAHDYVNTGTALAAEAACLLVADIDRGGAFAHLHGTCELMDPRVRARLRGFVLNKFRGDASLLAPAPELLRLRTGVPTLGVLPLVHHHGLPEEDAVHERTTSAAAAGPTVAVLATPHISNLDEFEPLRRAPGLRLCWTRDAASIAAADWLVLAGSKHTRADLRWLREQGLDRAIAARVQQGRPLLAICGGLQLLGRTIEDPLGIEGGQPGCDEGLGLLPLHTTFDSDKQVRPTSTRFAGLQGAWAALSGLEVSGYEIRAGRTRAEPGGGGCAEALSAGLGWQRGPILAVYLHGLFENAAVLDALFAVRQTSPEDAFERLAAVVEQACTREVLAGLLS